MKLLFVFLFASSIAFGQQKKDSVIHKADTVAKKDLFLLVFTSDELDQLFMRLQTNGIYPGSDCFMYVQELKKKLRVSQN
jgi:hypothetical protein